MQDEIQGTVEVRRDYIQQVNLQGKTNCQRKYVPK